MGVGAVPTEEKAKEYIRNARISLTPALCFNSSCTIRISPFHARLERIALRAPS
jgi:hypothetical protein